MVPLSKLGVRAVVTVVLIDRVRAQSTEGIRVPGAEAARSAGGDLDNYLTVPPPPLASGFPFRSGSPTILLCARASAEESAPP